MEGTHPLDRSWALWEMWDQNETTDTTEDLYLMKVQQVCTFSTAEAFLKEWTHLPHNDPRKLFSNYKENYSQLTEGFNKQIEALALFEEGVNPTWEDPVNLKGADFSIKRTFNLDVLAKVWEKLIFTLIGE
jgi:hypothetical protein